MIDLINNIGKSINDLTKWAMGTPTQPINRVQTIRNIPPQGEIYHISGKRVYPERTDFKSGMDDIPNKDNAIPIAIGKQVASKIKEDKIYNDPKSVQVINHELVRFN